LLSFQVVDDKIMPVMDFPIESKNWMMATPYTSRVMKEALLKKYFLNKIYGQQGQRFETELPYGKFDSELMFENTPITQSYSRINKVNPIIARLYGFDKINKMNRFDNVDQFKTIDQQIIDNIRFGQNKQQMINHLNLDEQLIGGEEKLINGGLNYGQQFNKFDKFETVDKMTPFEQAKMMNFINAKTNLEKEIKMQQLEKEIKA
jgi:hypothetical protein